MLQNGYPLQSEYSFRPGATVLHRLRNDKHSPIDRPHSLGDFMNVHELFLSRTKLLHIYYQWWNTAVSVDRSFRRLLYPMSDSENINSLYIESSASRPGLRLMVDEAASVLIEPLKIVRESWRRERLDVTTLRPENF